ncbi:MAG: adenylate kinase family protein, partial [Ilumatobacteraceae bacterium]
MTIRLVLLGRQGSGKGTQGARLAAHYGIAHISTGEMLRNAIKNATPVGKAVKEIIDNGGLVNDELMGSLVQGRLGEPDARTHGYLLDGFPRTLPQALA